ncbi:hypothetical protein [Microbacterium istanbulense]|uniref:AbiEi antitoxin C-terminal domain-containing protein n=1 Tax=Microbacterium istanbulense TaxID=3122049 RepID=A0ABU8LPN4_9MICO
MHPALLYLPGTRLSLPELTAARLDGHVVELGDAYVPADTVEGVDARAASVAAGIPDRMGACGPTAAWIHGAGLLPPPVHHVRRIAEGRFRPGVGHAVIVHEPALEPPDGVQISGVVVATPLFTGLELALGASTHPVYATWLVRLLEVMPSLRDDLRERLGSLPRRPGRAQARALLRADQEVVTR